ncbi:hypothetical protein JCM8097_009185 [Rhodosporidiobolus ruineniae]
MHAFALVAPLLVAGSASALAFEKRAGPLTSPGAAGFDYPPIRGWSSALQNDGPCGGYDVGGRTDFPLTGGDIAVALQRDVYDMKIGYSFKENPTSNDDFQNLFPNVSVTYMGSQCFQNPDFTALGGKAGDAVSLQITFQAGAGNKTFYECADITLVEPANFVKATDYTCANVTTSTQTIPNQAANAASSSAAAAAATTVTITGKQSGSSSNLTLAQAGAIGACVTLAVVAAALALAYVGGVARFGSRSKRAAQNVAAVPAYTNDRASMTSHGSMVKH